MKKVTGYIYVRALGCYDFEFFVEDNETEEEIRQKVENICQYSISYEIESGYEAFQETVYKKVK